MASAMACASAEGARAVLASRPLLSHALWLLEGGGGRQGPGASMALLDEDRVAELRAGAVLLVNAMTAGGEAWAAADASGEATEVSPAVLVAAAMLDSLGQALPRALAAGFCSADSSTLAALQPVGGGNGRREDSSGLAALVECLISLLKSLRWISLAPAGYEPMLEACLSQSGFLTLLAEVLGAVPIERSPPRRSVGSFEGVAANAELDWEARVDKTLGFCAEAGLGLVAQLASYASRERDMGRLARVLNTPGLAAAVSRTLLRCQTAAATGADDRDAFELCFVSGIWQIAHDTTDAPVSAAFCRALAASTPPGAAGTLAQLADGRVWQRGGADLEIAREAVLAASNLSKLVVAQGPQQPRPLQGTAARIQRSRQGRSARQDAAPDSSTRSAGGAGPSSSSSCSPATPAAGSARGAPQPQACSVCNGGPRSGATKLMVCGRCRSAGPRYCSKECQKAGWTAHKAVCRGARNA